MTLLTDILIIFGVAVPASYLFHKIKFPPIAGFLVTGALIGPFGMGLIGDVGRINILAEIGVALLVFSLGLEFSLKHFGELKRVALGGGALQIIITAVAVFAVSTLFSAGWREGVFLGCAFALSSTAIVYNILTQKRLIDSPHGRIATSILVLQDLSAIPMIALLPALSSGGGIGIAEIGTAVCKAAIVISIFWLGRRFLLSHFLHHVTLARSKELFLISIIAVTLGYAYLTARLGLSSALGAFLAGLMIADTDFRFHALSEIMPFRYCFQSLFFVSIGMLFNPAPLLIHWWWIPAIAVLLPVAKALITSSIVFILGYPIGVSAMSGLALAQVGEFSFVIAVAARQAGVVADGTFNFTVSAAFLTILITPLFMAVSPRMAELAERFIPLHSKRCAKRGQMIDADHLKNHVIICGFGPLGSSVGYMLKQAGKDYIVLELNPATVQKLKNRGTAVYLGDGASAEILYKSGIERADVLAITAPDYMNSMSIIRQARSMNKNLKIITRAKYKNQAADLYTAGADIVISEELEAGIEMGRYILLNMGVAETTINSYLETVRAFGSADFW